MINLVFAVFIGGGLGSVLRWFISLRLNNTSCPIAVGTLTANCIGAFIIGLGLAYFNKANHIDPAWKLMLTTGFCGGLTTFSTFSAEVFNLLQMGKVSWALFGIFINVMGSLLMTALAFIVMSKLS
ncbi:fluoride efflux transporter CrcB [Xenorhabdus szentirmaii]|uniref:Fluoride-specific ion channel FluC n=2 Tax=Xenorhabdus szentirmaii TaxID=290112 RepID=W1J0M1_9GAMM|nr:MULTISPECIES: fluoride efflux transporter CrcB [Xenorhabdus]MBD2780158.1 fluoride efflux transporter CrcB [Xenorhabdus sp. 38]MBD2793673.1 fluoride efflux transporter CrcB [Xenorhabdus sp. CUL]MBD2802087.1 fluoride efflux transporter CrcB [Xenorhabdus sp. M]MBD2806478.1 fluoride efflux transporter CrcB [Xenorhabdus sp. ZM]MBD2819962.1 fluoride efflux transporter CrcB [Xenorhabdus sp. 42]